MHPPLFFWVVPVLLLPLFLSTCDRAPGSAEFDPASRTYAFDLDNPADTVPVFMQFSSAGDHLYFGTDSVFRSNVFTNQQDTFLRRDRFPGDTLPKSVSYELAPDSSLLVRFWNQERLLDSRWFLPFRSDDQPLNINDWVGKTYWFPTDTTRTKAIHFSFLSYQDGGTLRERYFVDLRTLADAGGSKALEGSPTGMGNFGFLQTKPNPTVRFFGLSADPYRANLFFQLGRDASGAPFMAHPTNNGRGIDRQVLEPVIGVVPQYVDEEKIAERLNRGRIVVDQSFRVTEETGVGFLYEEDFARRGGLTFRDLKRLEFYFDPRSQEYNFFVGDRSIKSGKWNLSADRNFLVLTKIDQGGQSLLPLVTYNDEEIAFRLHLSVQTPQPRGKELLSYFDLDALVSVQEE